MIANVLPVNIAGWVLIVFSAIMPRIMARTELITADAIMRNEKPII
ncbi:MAG: hypothetical protein V1701_06285 [Planctomycetota bacterium]